MTENETAQAKPETDEPTAHKSLAAALVAVRKEVRRLEKTQENKHNKYKYVPIDDVKDFIRPILSQHGIDISVSESGDWSIHELPSRNGTTTTAMIKYTITLDHVDSELSPRAETITVTLPYVGAQTAGIGRSYAIKEWAKGTLLLSTGEDVDADADAAGKERFGNTKELDPYQQPKAKARAIYDALASDIRTHTDMDQLENWWNSQTIAEKFRALPPDWKRMAFIEFASQSMCIAESDGARTAFRKTYDTTLARLSDDELLAIDDRVVEAKNGGAA
jgi:hypothetical protein